MKETGMNIWTKCLVMDIGVITSFSGMIVFFPLSTILLNPDPMTMCSFLLKCLYKKT